MCLRILRTTDMSDDGVLIAGVANQASLYSCGKCLNISFHQNALITMPSKRGRVAMLLPRSNPCTAGAYLLEFGLKPSLIHLIMRWRFSCRLYGQQHLLQGSRSVAQAEYQRAHSDGYIQTLHQWSLPEFSKAARCVSGYSVSNNLTP